MGHFEPHQSSFPRSLQIQALGNGKKWVGKSLQVWQQKRSPRVRVAWEFGFLDKREGVEHLGQTLFRLVKALHPDSHASSPIRIEILMNENFVKICTPANLYIQ